MDRAAMIVIPRCLDQLSGAGARESGPSVRVTACGPSCRPLAGDRPETVFRFSRTELAALPRMAGCRLPVVADRLSG
jgi:hypothetical protein